MHPNGERPGGPRKPRAKRRGRGVTWYTTGRGRVASSSTARVASRGGCGFTEPCHGRHTTLANRADYRLSISYLRAATMWEKEPFKFQRHVSDNVAPSPRLPALARQGRIQIAGTVCTLPRTSPPPRSSETGPGWATQAQVAREAAGGGGGEVRGVWWGGARPRIPQPARHSRIASRLHHGPYAGPARPGPPRPRAESFAEVVDWTRTEQPAPQPRGRAGRRG